MEITYHPQRAPGQPAHRLDYRAEGDILIITHTAGEVETTDTFDFTALPDGRCDASAIATRLPVQPILAAERTDGVLHVTLLDWTREA